MHGLIFGELKQYVAARLGDGAWNELLEQAGIGPKLYLAIQEYPDSEALAIVAAASKRTGIAVPDLLFDFGVFIGPELAKMYRAYIRPDWKTIDVIEHTEERIHKMVRLNHNGARPPYLTATRRGEKEIVVHYASDRKLCWLAKGIATGVGKHYGETIQIEDLTCMHRGDKTCELLVRAVG